MIKKHEAQSPEYHTQEEKIKDIPVESVVDPQKFEDIYREFLVVYRSSIELIDHKCLESVPMNTQIFQRLHENV